MTFHPFGNLGLKIASIFIAVLLWLIVAGPSASEKVLVGVPVQARNVGTGLAARVRPATVTVRATGSRGTLSALTAEQMTVFVDVAGRETGTFRAPVRVAPVAGLAETLVEPREVTVTVETGS